MNTQTNKNGESWKAVVVRILRAMVGGSTGSPEGGSWAERVEEESRRQAAYKGTDEHEWRRYEP